MRHWRLMIFFVAVATSLTMPTAQAAYPEKEGANYLVLRGQGGEEVVFSVAAADGVTRIRASTLLFDQAVSRFLSTLPATAGVAV